MFQGIRLDILGTGGEGCELAVNVDLRTVGEMRVRPGLQQGSVVWPDAILAMTSVQHTGRTEALVGVTADGDAQMHGFATMPALDGGPSDPGEWDASWIELEAGWPDITAFFPTGWTISWPPAGRAPPPGGDALFPPPKPAVADRTTATGTLPADVSIGAPGTFEVKVKVNGNPDLTMVGWVVIFRSRINGGAWTNGTMKRLQKNADGTVGWSGEHGAALADGQDGQLLEIEYFIPLRTDPATVSATIHDLVVNAAVANDGNDKTIVLTPGGYGFDYWTLNVTNQAVTPVEFGAQVTVEDNNTSSVTIRVTETFSDTTYTASADIVASPPP